MIRLLPIFSVLYVYRHAANDELNSQHDFWQLGLYVGPSSSVPGAIRAAVLINKRLHIITTTAIKGVSDGGHVAIYPTTDSSIDCLLETHDPSKDDSLQIMQFSDDPVPVSQTSLSHFRTINTLNCLLICDTQLRHGSSKHIQHSRFQAPVRKSHRLSLRNFPNLMEC